MVKTIFYLLKGEYSFGVSLRYLRRDCRGFGAVGSGFGTVSGACAKNRMGLGSQGTAGIPIRVWGLGFRGLYRFRV